MTTPASPAVPQESLGRIRRVPYLMAMAVLVLGVPVIAVSSTAPTSWRLAALGGLVWLGASWSYGYFRRSFPWWRQLPDTVALLVVVLGAGGPHRSLGVFYAGLYLRSLYGQRSGHAWAAVSYSAAFMAAVVLSPEPLPWAVFSPETLYQLLGFAVTVLIAETVTGWQTRQESAVARERVLARAGTRLLASGSHAEVHAVLAAVAPELVRTTGLVVEVAVAEGQAEAMEVVSVPAALPQLAGLVMDLRDAPGRVLAELLVGHTVPVELTQLPELERALRPAAVLGQVLLVPLLASGRLSGVVLVVSAAPVPEAAREALSVLSSQAALAQASILRDARFRSLVQKSSDGITVLGVNGLITYQSPGIQQVLGYRPGEVVGTPLRELLHPEDLPRLMEMRDQLTRQPGRSAVLQGRVRHRDGTWHTIEATATSMVDDPAVQGIVINSRDVTERVRAEADMHHRLGLEHALAEAAQRLGSGGEVELTEVLRLLGEAAGVDRAYLFAGEPGGTTVRNLAEWHGPACPAPPDRLLGFEAGVFPLAEPLRRGENVVIPDTGVLPPDAAGQRALLEERRVRAMVAVPLRCDAGVLAGFLGVDDTHGPRAWSAHDVQVLRTASELLAAHLARRRAEAERARSLALLRATLDATADGILVGDERGGIVLYNRQFAEMWGIPEELLAAGDNERAMREVMPRLKHPEQLRESAQHLGQDADAAVHDLIEFTDGRVFERVSRPQRLYGDSVGRVFSFRDITQQRQLEEQLRQAQKMEAVGRLAGGVAHDFNNILTIIQANASLLRMELPATGEGGAEAEEIERAAERAAALTRQLLAFGRRQLLQPRAVDLNEVVVAMQRMLARLIGANIRIVTRLAPGSVTVQADPGQLEQVVMNLAVNARDAMPEGGVLTLETRLVDEAQPRDRRDRRVPPGRQAVLSVSDTGHGMDDETLTRAFEPFFTTKEPGKGTGLGLATVYGIVKQSGGEVWVESEPGHGTRITLTLPCAAALPAGEAAAPPPAPGPSEARTVLLVEDEDAVRTVARRILERGGFRVLEAADADEGMHRLHAHAGPVHLLLTDVLMPGRSGPALAEEALRVRPALRVLFMSGYAQDELDSLRRFGDAAGFLAKPFSPDELLRRARAVLEGAAPGEEGQAA